MHDALIYVQTRHPYGDIPGQPSQAPDPVPQAKLDNAEDDKARTNGVATQHDQQDQGKLPPPPAPAGEFDSSVRESARKILLQQQQIEAIFERLPGIAKTEAEQEARMRQLEVQLREGEQKRAKAEDERERMVDLLGNMIVGAKREP